jgi:hypothetical protein
MRSRFLAARGPLGKTLLATGDRTQRLARAGPPGYPAWLEMEPSRMPTYRRAALAFAFVTSLAWIGPPAWATDLAAHRAVYDLKLESSKGGAVTAARGHMDYEMLDVCDGWTTHQFMDMTITNSDGQDIDMQSDYITFESKDGLKLHYRMRQTTDQAVTDDVQGDATLQPNGGGGEARFTLPQESMKRLPRGTLFPTMHTAALLAAAEQGKKMLALPLFDGTTEKGAQDSFIIVTHWGGPRPDKWPSLAKLPSGRFHLTFFDRAPSATEPDYEVSMRYWANGVADDLSMDFGDFVMGGKLREFSPVPPHGC